MLLLLPEDHLGHEEGMRSNQWGLHSAENQKALAKSRSKKRCLPISVWPQELQDLWMWMGYLPARSAEAIAWRRRRQAKVLILGGRLLIVHMLFRSCRELSVRDLGLGFEWDRRC